MPGLMTGMTDDEAIETIERVLEALRDLADARIAVPAPDALRARLRDLVYELEEAAATLDEIVLAGP